MRHPLTLLCAGLACLTAVIVLVACGKYGAPRAASTTVAARPAAPPAAGDAEPRGLATRHRSARPGAKKTSTRPKSAPTQTHRHVTVRPTPVAQPKPKPYVPAPKPVRIAPLPSVAPPLLLGFQDDAGFRWSAGRQALVDRATDAGASVIRTTANWSEIAATKPANARNAFDPAYRFDDLDELARNAQRRGLPLLITIWGTPAWANDTAGSNHAPAHASDLEDFARALTERYSGRHAGYPYVGLYSIWNEPNLAQFLAPQFDSAGKAVAPATYARLYRAAYAGIKAVNPRALVAIGETSPRGRDVLTTSGVQQSE